MTPTKLSESDKHEILGLYRHSEENTITLAKRYGVSSSTVRRILQSALSEAEYDALVHQKQKRLPHSQSSISQPIAPDVDEPADTNLSESVYPGASDPIPNSKLIRKRTRATPETRARIDVREVIPRRLDVSDLPEEDAAEFVDDDYGAGARNLEEMLGDEGPLEAEEFSDFDEDEEDDDEDDDEDLDDFGSDDLEDDDFEGMTNSRPGVSIQLRSKTLLQVLPLSEASLPKICYLVVDRAAELITRPLKAFGELGQIPPEEIREKTLPVFDNHRVARRFSTRNQRVFKVPDGQLLQKTAPYLQAKGITRLLIDGQVYSL